MIDEDNDPIAIGFENFKPPTDNFILIKSLHNSTAQLLVR